MKDGAPLFDTPRTEHGVFCNRTMNFRSIRVFGYDMDYTLIHYHTDAWEEIAYNLIRDKLEAMSWPVEGLAYRPGFIVRGLVLDRELGNILKTNRFGFVKAAYHGTTAIPFEKVRELYSRTVVDVRESRFVFLHTLFNLSEGCMFAQMIERLDRGELPDALGYEELYRKIHTFLDEAHAEGMLKGEVLRRPSDYIVLEEETVNTLLDQKNADRYLALITNSDWHYTRQVMAYAFDRFMPEGQTWRDLFDLVIVSARKPSFFQHDNPAFRIINEEGQLEPADGGFEEGGFYVGGNARMVEQLWGLEGEQILYVGDHIFADVTVSKDILRWRTALVLRELEEELVALGQFREQQEQLGDLMRQKRALEYQESRFRLEIQRISLGYLPSEHDLESLRQQRDRLREELRELDLKISPLAKASSELLNEHWGLLMRAGNDKSLLARQVERYADIYTSRVANLCYQTPFTFLRSPRSSLPHDAMGVQTNLDGLTDND